MMKKKTKSVINFRRTKRTKALLLLKISLMDKMTKIKRKSITSKVLKMHNRSKKVNNKALRVKN